MLSYTFAAAPQPPSLTTDTGWSAAQVVAIDQFHPRSSDHHPRVTARGLCDRDALYLRFDVDDRYVVSRATEFQQNVCTDSCVEFFVQPVAGKGYFNFEFNCGGTLLLHYITDPTRTPKGFARSEPVTADAARHVQIAHSMPKTVLPERSDPVSWWLASRIPLDVFRGYVGEITSPHWRGNFYKCADHSSHPHWASWSPIGEALNFHQPDKFGQLIMQGI